MSRRSRRSSLLLLAATSITVLVACERGEADRESNLLKNSPHPLADLLADNWDRPYSRERAAFPTAATRDHKIWPPIGRIDAAYGDRNLVCVCPPVEAYATV